MVEDTAGLRSDNVWHPVAGWHYPTDVAEFRAWFRTDSDCVSYLGWLRWPNGFVCPFCGADSATLTNGIHRCHGCRRRISVTSGTMFDKTRVPLTTWFEVIWLFTVSKAGVSASTIQRILPIHSIQTAWAMLARLRAVAAQSDSGRLTGRVEVDETLIGGIRAGKPGRGANGKTLVAGAIEVTEQGWGRVRLSVIPDASTASLRAFITANVEPGATVVSDAWVSYPPALESYVHEAVNVSASGHPAHESLPAVHRIFALVKRLLDGTYQGGGSANHLQGYLDEFTFRFNRRKSRHRGLLFMRLLQKAVQSKPITFRELTGTDALREQCKQQPPAKTNRKPGSLEVPTANRPWLIKPPAETFGSKL